MNASKIVIILTHAFIGWALCFATIGIGMAVTSMDTALIIHAIVAPIFFAAISFFYFRKFNYTTPLQTAGIFLSFILLMDFFLVAMLINRSFEMFSSLLGTWIPFTLIFASTLITGIFVRKVNGTDWLVEQLDKSYPRFNRTSPLIEENMNKKPDSSQSLAEAITKSASRQTYYTIWLLVDRERVADAFRAYAYFRWVDDVLDTQVGSQSEKFAFVNRQITYLEACYRRETPQDLSAEEQMLSVLVRNDKEMNSGLQTYLSAMMEVMIFDVSRRGQVITQAGLSEYTRKLSTAVTEAIYYFVGHDDPVPQHETRYLAVSAAHMIHMLRDAFEDTAAGYFNIPGEYLQTHGISERELESQAYRQWVCGRVQLARKYFKMSRESHAQIKSLRCRLASSAYMARFEWMLRTIERENYCLRCEYPDRKSLRSGLWMGWSILSSVFLFPWHKLGFETRIKKLFR